MPGVIEGQDLGLFVGDDLDKELLETQTLMIGVEFLVKPKVLLLIQKFVRRMEGRVNVKEFTAKFSKRQQIFGLTLTSSKRWLTSTGMW